MLRQVTPILRVTSIDAAEAFYCGKLGFRRVFRFSREADGGDPAYLGIERDGVPLHLSSFGGDGVFGASVYIEVDDVDALHAEFVAKGAAILHAPAAQDWARREMYVRDLSGNTLRFANLRKA